MTRQTTRRCVFAFAPSLLIIGMLSTTSWASGEQEEIEFEEAEIFFELNDTDGDLGIHALIDGDPWKKIRIKAPDGKRMLDLRLKGRLKQQGLTELFFESAEPSFDELEPAAFFERFPPGEYKIHGRTLEGQKIRSETELTHVMPAPPDFTINGLPARPQDGSDCDEEDPAELTNPVVIEWNAITESHPDLGAFSDDLEVLRYQIVAEYEDDDERAFVSSVDITPDDETAHYSVTVSPEFFVDETEVKFEVLVREASSNQTAVESCPFEFVEALDD